MSTTYRLFANTSWGIIAKIANRVSHALIGIFISRFIGVNATGAYNIGLTYLTIGLSFAVWGFDQNMILEVSSDKERVYEYFGNLLILQAIFGIFVFVCLNIISLYAPYPEQTRIIVRVLSLSLISESIITICQAVFIAFEQLKIVSIVNTVFAVIKVTTITVMIYLDINLIEIVWIFTGISFLLMAVFIFITRDFLPKQGFIFDLNFCLSQLKKSSIFFVISVLYSFESRIDVFILSFLSTNYYVGLYTAALGIVSFFYLIPQAFRDAVFPIFSRLHFTKPKSAEILYQISTKYILLLTIPICIGVSIFATEIILFIYQEPFINAAALLSITIWIFPIISIMILNTRVLIIDRKGKSVIRFLIISPILLIILNYILYPYFGISISSVIRVFSPLIVTIGTVWFVAKHVYKPKIGLYLIKLILSLFIMGSIVYYTKPFNFILSITLGILVYCVTLYIFKVFTQEDLTYWQSIIKQVKLGMYKGT